MAATIPTPKEFYEEMKTIQRVWGDTCDQEDCHKKMDNYMCETLVAMGYEKGIDIFRETPKWYA